MKKLFLTSVGFVNKNVADLFLKELNKKPNACKVFMVAAGLTDEENFYIEESRKELADLGFENIFIFNLNAGADFYKEFENSDVIYICGGNTYYILQKIKEIGLDKKIIEAIGNGKIYVGVSAGSIIAGPDIDIAGWGIDGDLNEVKLKDLSGLNLTDISIFPHFDETRNRQEVEEFKKTASHTVIELTDNQAVFVSGNNFRIIGNRL